MPAITAQETQTDIVDPRRQQPIKVQWSGLIGRLYIDGVSWGAVEWSEKRKAFCIEDAEGRCLSHHSHIHGEDKDKAGAVALAEAMIRDGRMPTPEDARKSRRERLKAGRERRAKTPSGIRRAERDRLQRLSWDAQHQVRDAERDEPLYETIIDAIDLNDPNLWRSNSFARLRDRLILLLRADIAELESDFARDRGSDVDKKQLARAREILAQVLRG
jgi:hypothetical protein